MNNREKYAIDISSGKSYCIGCKQYLLLTHFTKSKNSSTGYYWNCKNCRSEWFKRWYDTNPEAQRVRAQKFRINNIERYLLQGAKARAKRDNLEFNITLEDITPLPTHCPVFNIPLFVAKRGEKFHNSYSLDRIDNTKGYIKGNVLVISRKANILKSDMDLSTMKRLYEFYKTYLEEKNE